jgi:N-acetyl-anhydromuramyl-L-alanine amidase AmpD
MGDGEIAVGRRWTEQLDGGHLASEAQNKVALGICLVGNFDEHRPSPREMESLWTLVEALMVRCKLTPGAVKTHQQINIVHTRCPGVNFPAKSFLDSLRSPGR